MIGTRLAQRYELIGELGRGGMGVVYLARDPHLDREVAVKVLSAVDLSDAAEERFLREAQLVARMDHPSIVPIFDLGRHEDVLFFVMPVARGQTLHDINKADTLAFGDTLEIVAQVAEALDYSHQQGVVHRDIKPENIMITAEEEADGLEADSPEPRSGLRARVMDFGLALRDEGHRLTRTGNLPGTLGYLSPEQILGVEVDGRSDLYSLATILYECLAGRPPFVGSRYQLLFKIVNEEPSPLADFGVDPRLEEVVRRCLAKEAGDRPQRGNEMAALLRQFAESLTQTGLEREVSISRPAPPPPMRPALAPLIGRDGELAELWVRLDKAAAGECQLVLIGGEAGMGKTRLLQEIEQIAGARGFQVLHGRFSDQESAFPFQAFGELIQDFFRGTAGSVSSADAGLPDMHDLEDDLQTLFPALSELDVLRSPSSSGSAGADLRRPGLALAAARRGDPTHFFEVLARTLTRLAGGRPTCFLLEHLHGAEISIEALQYIVRRLRPAPCLFVGTYRPSEVPRRHPLSRLLKSVKDEPRFSSLALEPLEAPDLYQLVAAQLGGGEVSRELAVKIFEATEGNPFFAQELVRSLLEATEVSRDSSGIWALSGDAAISTDSLPETIQQAVESRLERLPEELFEVLQVGSVLGRTFEYQDLEALVADDLEEAVEKLLRDGLLDEDRQSRGDLLQFSSGVVRDVLYGDLSRRRRRMLHRRHAGNLEQRYAGRLEQAYPQLVHHFAAGDVAEKTVGYALELARNSLDAMGSAIAIHALRTALEFVEDEEIGRAIEGELHFLLARALRAAGSNEPAVKEAARAVRVFQQIGEKTAAAAAAALAAETAWQGRRVGETRSWVEKGIDLARAASSPHTLHKLLTLGATVANLRGEYQKARARWEEAQELVAAASPDEEPLPRGGALSTSLSVAITTLDPRQAVTIEEKEVLANIFEPLIRSGAEGLLQPCLCEGWQKSSDGRTFRLRLRRDVRFSDGTPMAAADVKGSLARPFGKTSPPALVALEGYAEPVEEPGSGVEIPGIQIVDDYTLEFRLREPLSIFPILLSDLSTAVCRLDERGQLIGTGPFCLDETRQTKVRLARNPHYWRGSSALLDTLEFRTYADSTAAAAALRAGDLDIGRDFRPDELDHLLRDPRFRTGLVEATRHNVYLVALNLAGPVTHQAEVRRALVDVTRVQDVVWSTLGRFAQPASCLIPPGILGHDPGRRLAQLSRKEARELLAEAGLEPPVELQAAAHPLFFDRYRTFLDALLREWEAIGVTVAFAGTGRDFYLEKAHRAHGIDLWIGRWVADYHDPDTFTLGLLHSREGILGDYFHSPEVDKYAVEARQADTVTRQKLYHRLESVLADERALLPLFYDIDYRVLSSRVRGLRLLNQPPYVNYPEVAKLEKVAAVEASGRDSGTLHVPLPAAFEDLAPRQAQILGSVEAVGNVFETLTRLDEGARIVPCLASEFRLEDGGRRFRFKLRSQVRFHDGRKLTVRDVRYSFEELVRGLSAEAFAAGLVPIRGGRAFWEDTASELEGFEIVSANEFVIELERPLSFFPAMLTSSSTAIVPEGTRSYEGNWREGPVGTGPFRVLRFDPSDRLELEAHPHYWRRGLPKCNRLVFEIGLGAEETLAELRGGRLAVASALRPADVDELLTSSAFAAGYREAPGFSTYFLILDVRRGALSDPEVRTAFRQVVEDINLVRSTLGRLAAPAQGLIPPGLLGHEPRERRAASAAGERSTSSIRPLAGIELRAAVFPAYLQQFAPFWEALTQTLEKAGATLSVVAASPIETLWRITHQEIDLAGARWAASYPDPDALIHFFHSRGYLGDLVGSAELSELFARGRNETDPALRHTVYRQIDQILGRHTALVPLFHEQVYRVGHPEVEGLRLRFGWPEVAYEELSLKP